MAKDKSINDFEDKIVFLVCQELLETCEMLEQFDGPRATALRDDLRKVLWQHSK